MNRRQWLGDCLTGLASLSGAPRLAASHRSAADAAPPRRGVNLAGAEFGVRRDFCNENPGAFGRDYTYNSEPSIAYFAERGITLFRVPFRWERIQPRLGQ